MRIILSILLFATAMQAQTPAADAPTTDDQKALYTLGQLLGENVANISLTDDEYKFLIQGLSDQAFGRPSKLDVEKSKPLVEEFMNRRVQAAAEAELVKSNAFLEEQSKKPGAVRTESGIIIEEMKKGTGPTPA